MDVDAATLFATAAPGTAAATPALGQSGQLVPLNNDLRARFAEFLQHDFGGTGPATYEDRIRLMIDRRDSRLVFNMNDLRAFNPDLAREYVSNPMEAIPAFEAAVRDLTNDIEAQYFDDVERICRVGAVGSFGRNHVTPRGLMAKFLNQIVCVEGIVTKASLSRPKVVRSVHYCPKTQRILTKEYHDATSLTHLPTSAAYPTRDADGNTLVSEFGLSTYRDFQVLTLQEPPERAPPGQLPRSVDVLVEGDLVNRAKPVDRVQIMGVYRALPGKSQVSSSGVFRTVLVAYNITSHGSSSQSASNSNIKLTDADIRNIRSLASKKRDVFSILANSVAPSIYGHEYIKKALLLQMLSGVEKNLPNGLHLRGDINILMVGDPSTAKSQVLRAMMQMAPLAVSTTGRGSSGVGLTAAVVTDSDTGERTLQAGAMVLADRGIVCIDEFDKMSDADRVALHEVMEQQTVTIAKAGIHTSLNARTSVLAAANPVYGMYDRELTPARNIGLPDSLLSRFDLLFIVLDQPTPDNDRRVSDHVLRLHRFRGGGENSAADAGRAGEDDDREREEDDTAQGGDFEEQETPVFEKYDRLLHSHRKGPGSRRDGIISLAFLQKYVHYAKSKISPALTEAASTFISEAYAELRGREDARTMPITARTLETLIRLATAHAKCRLSNSVEKRDAEVAVELVKFALYNEAEVQKRRRRRPEADGGSDTSDTSGDEDDDTPKTPKKSRTPSTTPSATPGSSSRSRRRKIGRSSDARSTVSGDTVHSSAVFDFGDEEEEIDGDEAEFERTMAEAGVGARKGGKKRQRVSQASTSSVEKQLEKERADERSSQKESEAGPSSSQPVEVSANKRREFTRLISAVFAREDRMNFDVLSERINAGASESFSRAEIETLLNEMQEANHVMYHDGVVHMV